MSGDPHAGGRLATAGQPLESAAGAMVMIHGRGATAGSILSLARELPHSGFAFLAPQAARHTWYPHSFLALLEANEPWLSSALKVLGRVVEKVESAGIARDRIILLGFSQGACLTSEFAARNAGRYGGVVALTGGLLGPSDRAFDFTGDFAGTPVLLAAGDPDPHVPWQRVEESASVFRGLGAEVTLKQYPGMGHTINEEQVQLTRDLMACVAGA